ncbi:MAG: DUF424 family protein [Promethearchaeati archaeon SRVP18_Atabeyarchaeia-1]
MEIYLKEFHSKGDVVVAACDPELLGKCFKEGRLVLDVRKEFYEGSLVSVEEALAAIESSTIANIVGEKIVFNAIKAGLICEESVLTISKVPHAQRIVL